jgi:hypothetical protein
VAERILTLQDPAVPRHTCEQVSRLVLSRTSRAVRGGECSTLADGATTCVWRNVIMHRGVLYQGASNNTPMVEAFTGCCRGVTTAEEFLALLPAIDLPAAYEVAEKLRQAVQASPDPITGRIAVSIGLGLPNSEQTDDDIAVREADEALYRAKSAGRNQVQAAPKLLAQVKADDMVAV